MRFFRDYSLDEQADVSLESAICNFTLRYTVVLDTGSLVLSLDERADVHVGNLVCRLYCWLICCLTSNFAGCFDGRSSTCNHRCFSFWALLLVELAF